MGIVPDVHRCVTMDAKEADNVLLIVGSPTGSDVGGSHFEILWGGDGETRALPAVNLDLAPRVARAVAELISDGSVRSAHDCSEGGLLVAAAEMAMAGGLGLQLDLTGLPTEADPPLEHRCFGEQSGRYLIEVSPDDLAAVGTHLGDLPWAVIGTFHATRRLTLSGDKLDVPLEEHLNAWLGTLDW